MKLILIRHGITQWNLEKRIQGHIDQPLCPLGIEHFKNKQLNAELAKITWYCSPLKRALHTAELLKIKNPIIEPALIEMHWGDWEGKILKPLRKTLGDEMRENEARGLDFCPPNGESPRQVQARVTQWIEVTAQQYQEDFGAIAHKGIIRCLYALATGWDMRGETPTELNWEHAHVFEISSSGNVHGYLGSINLSEVGQT